MEKIILPLDRALSAVGRLVLARPILSIALFVMAIATAVYTNEVWYTSASDNTAEQPAIAPPLAPQPAASSPVTATAQPASTTAATSQPTTAWKIATVKSGDTLSRLLKKHGFSAKEVAVLSRLSSAKALRHLKLGQEIRFAKDANGKLQQLAYAVNDKSTLNVTRLEGKGTNFKATTEATPISAVALISPAAPVAEQLASTTTATSAPKGPPITAEKLAAPVLASSGAVDKIPVATISTTDDPKATKVDESAKTSAATEKVTATKETTAPTSADPKATKVAANDSTPALTYVSGRITRSLATDAKKAGLSAKQVNQLVAMFGQKNVAQNMRRGDEFSVLYQSGTTKKTGKSVKGSKPVPSSTILAAHLTARGKSYQLIRFTDPKGRVEYYTPEGKSLRDGLSRQPLNFTYISSYFSGNRLDPVLGYRHPHAGVDFAAPIGTPVQAAGNGVLADMGYRGGYGRMVTIDHDDKYTTRYAHLSKFASNVRVGQNVQKGQIIGYVGRSGFATGAHLHYEIRVNDIAANPLTVALPGASIPVAYRGQFLAQSRTLLAHLNTKRQTWLAQAKSTSVSPQKGRG